MLDVDQEAEVKCEMIDEAAKMVTEAAKGTEEVAKNEESSRGGIPSWRRSSTTWSCVDFCHLLVALRDGGTGQRMRKGTHQTH